MTQTKEIPKNVYKRIEFYSKPENERVWASCPQCLRIYDWMTDKGHKSWCDHFIARTGEAGK